MVPSIRDILARRWYAVYASGHGSHFVRDKSLYTKKRALYEADRWIGDACTIGGDAQVVNVLTGKIIYLERMRGYRFWSEAT